MRHRCVISHTQVCPSHTPFSILYPVPPFHLSQPPLCSSTFSLRALSYFLCPIIAVKGLFTIVFPSLSIPPPPPPLPVPRYARTHRLLVFEGKDYGPIAQDVVRACRRFKMCNLHPILVFDCISYTTHDKMGEKVSRASSRSHALSVLNDMGWDTMTKEEQALHQHDRDSWLGKAITISADLTRCVIKAVREAGFACFVSPGEADQQLVHLCRSGLADYIWTMDGDIVAQGVPVIRDLDFTTKFGVVYQLKASKWWKSVRSSYVFAFFAGCD